MHASMHAFKHAHFIAIAQKPTHRTHAHLSTAAFSSSSGPALGVEFSPVCLCPIPPSLQVLPCRVCPHLHQPCHWRQQLPPRAVQQCERPGSGVRQGRQRSVPVSRRVNEMKQSPREDEIPSVEAGSPHLQEITIWRSDQDFYDALNDTSCTHLNHQWHVQRHIPYTRDSGAE